MNFSAEHGYLYKFAKYDDHNYINKTVAYERKKKILLCAEIESNRT